MTNPGKLMTNPGKLMTNPGKLMTNSGIVHRFKLVLSTSTNKAYLRSISRCQTYDKSGQTYDMSKNNCRCHKLKLCLYLTS